MVFLGPAARFGDKPAKPPADAPAAAPRFFDFQYRPWRRMVAAGPDSIAGTVSDLKGRTMIVRTPADFARAIDQLEKLAAPAAR